VGLNSHFPGTMLNRAMAGGLGRIANRTYKLPSSLELSRGTVNRVSDSFSCVASKLNRAGAKLPALSTLSFVVMFLNGKVSLISRRS